MDSSPLIAHAPLDPAPRSYSAEVWLLRRSSTGAAAAPARTTVAEIEDWLLGDALNIDDLLLLTEALMWRLVAAGLPLDRASLHVGTLHPQLLGFGWNWSRDDGFCDETKVGFGSLETDAFRRSPLKPVVKHGEKVRLDATDPALQTRFPLLAELAARGITEYVAFPLHAGGTYHNAASVATCQPGGFTDAQQDELKRIGRLFALHVERHIALRVAGNVLDIYLGRAAGARVLEGSIKRGSGESIRAVIWASDLRGFTTLADRAAGPDTIALLNHYFERLAAPVLAQGGEVLKFIGDGLLAVFPYADFGVKAQAAEAALAAAEQAIAAVAELNTAPPEDLQAIAGWQPLVTGIALHEGEVFFGNVGAPARLDFTVIGPAVNTASRVEALSKELGRDILLTDAVARLLTRPLDPLGAHTLRGLAEPVTLFSPPTSLAA